MRESGILLHISSLPSPYGIGNLGRAAFDFIDFLADAGQSYWQILPIGPTGVGDSPYQSCSVYAGNPYFIDPDQLLEQGLLEPSDFENTYWGADSERVDYGAVYYYRYPLLEKAYTRGRRMLSGELARFRRENPWVEDYGLFMALKRKYGMLPWSQWPAKAATRDPEALERYRDELYDDIGFYVYMQYLFYGQWFRLRAYAKEKRIQIIGDMPIYVPDDSVEAWMYPELFQFDEHRRPTCVAGVPPDFFNEDGQLWGNPIYNWEKMAEDGFQWWRERTKAAAVFFDVIRIDHFRGLESYWAVPFGDRTARFGEWRPGPGIALVNALKEECPETKFIAEDLGYLTPSVRKLQLDSGWPGMKILEFAFDGDPTNAYLPHNLIRNSVVYTGTHDNEPLEGWYSHCEERNTEYAMAYLDCEREKLVRSIILAGMRSVSDLFVALMQDWLELGSEARMNEPGFLKQENWSWRLKELPDAAFAAEIRDITFRYGRCDAPELPGQAEGGETAE